MKKHMIVAMKQLKKACIEQYNEPGSCKNCVLYDENALNDGVADMNTHFCNACYPLMWEPPLYPDMKEDDDNGQG